MLLLSIVWTILRRFKAFRLSMTLAFNVKANIPNDILITTEFTEDTEKANAIDFKIQTSVFSVYSVVQYHLANRTAGAFCKTAVGIFNDAAIQ